MDYFLSRLVPRRGNSGDIRAKSWRSWSILFRGRIITDVWWRWSCQGTRSAMPKSLIWRAHLKSWDLEKSLVPLESSAFSRSGRSSLVEQVVVWAWTGCLYPCYPAASFVYEWWLSSRRSWYSSRSSNAWTGPYTASFCTICQWPYLRHRMWGWHTLLRSCI